MGKLSKAWAGGIAGAVAAVGTVVFTGDAKRDAAAYIGAALVGFAVGFASVWIAPANKIK